MSDLKSSTQALLELGRLGGDPTDAEVGKNRRALTQKLGAAALGAGVVAGSTTKAAAASVAAWTTTKVALLCGVVLVGGAVTWSVTQPRGGSQRAPGAALVASATLGAATPLAPASLATPTEAPAPELPVVTESPAPTPRAVASSPSASARSIKQELELVRAAQERLNRGEPQAALALLAEHAQKFPSGVLSEEREASRVFATCRAGNAAGARKLADAFLRRAPQSAFIDRVRAACREPAPASSR